MTKPTSWCIDIRQEHPLMDKFKEWHANIHILIYQGLEFPLWGCDGKNGFGRYSTEKNIEFITLDQRRELRGKEYYENNLNN